MSRLKAPRFLTHMVIAATGTLSLPAFAQNLHVSGKIGIATASPSTPLHVASCAGQLDCAARDGSLAGGGYVLLGDQTGPNLVLDNNEILARNNSAASDLYINKDGGNLHLTMHSGTTIIGSETSYRFRPLLVVGGNDIDLNDTGGGFIQVGSDSGANLVIDSNEIMARNGSGPSATPANLYLNKFPGAQVRVMSPIYISSDRKLKRDIATISKPLERIASLRGVTWRWKHDAANSARSMGIIAQDVEREFPEIVSVDPDSGMRGVQYEALIGPMIEAIKALKADNEALTQTVKKLSARVNREAAQ